MFLKKIITIALSLLVLSSCTLWKANEWNSHKVILEVHDEAGGLLTGVKIQSLARHKELTNKLAQSTLFFTQSGLHIVTLQSEKTITKQIQIKIPDDANKIIVVILQSK